MTKGWTIKEELLKATYISVSIVNKDGSFQLTKDVFDAHKETVKEKEDIMIEKLRIEEVKYRKNVQAVERLWDEMINWKTC